MQSLMQTRCDQLSNIARSLHQCASDNNLVKLHCQASCIDVIINIKLAKTAWLADADSRSVKTAPGLR